MFHCELFLSNLAETACVGEVLADTLPQGCVVLLYGELGAGKTQLVRFIAERWGAPPDEIASPTFVIARTYRGSRTVYHMDAYRLRDEDELDQIGLDEHLFADESVFIEWPEKIAAALPGNTLNLRIQATGPDARKITLDATDAAYQGVFRQLAERFKT